MRYVVLVWNNEGGVPAVICDNLDAVRQVIRAYLTDKDSEPPQSPEEFERMTRDLRGLTGDFVESVRGSDAWKEHIYIAPLSDGKQL